MAITWSGTEPTVSEWSETVYTTANHYSTSNANWYARIGYSIGWVTGTTDIAVRAIVEGRKASGWGAQNPNATPSVKLDSGEYVSGGNQGRSINSTTYQTIATRYAVITGAKSTSEITGQMTQNSAIVIMASPLPNYTITFDPNDGSGEQSGDCDYGAIFTFPSNALTPPSGYAFKEWNTAADGTGTTYNPGDTVTITSARTFYAIWYALSIIRLKHNGAWMTVTSIFVKVAGVWRRCVGVYGKDGTWKQSL